MSKLLSVSVIAVAGALFVGCPNHDHDNDARKSSYEMGKATANSDTATAKSRGTMVDRSEGSHTGTSSGGQQIDGIGTGAPTDTVPEQPR